MITENQERINVLENKREVEEGTSLRERVRNIFKKYCFTGSAVVLAAGTTTSCLRSRICHINKHRSETAIITFFEAEVSIWWNSRFCSYSFERWRVNHYLADWTVGCQEEPIHFEFHPSQSESLWRWSRCETWETTRSVPDFRYFCIFWHQQRYVVFKPQVNESEQQRRNEIREIEEMLWGNPKSYPENQSIKSRRRKARRKNRRKQRDW